MIYSKKSAKLENFTFLALDVQVSVNFSTLEKIAAAGLNK